MAHGTWKQTGGGSDGTVKALTVLAVAAVMLGGGTAAGVAAHVSAALTDLLYWAAGVTGTVIAASAAVLAWWLHGKPEREARAAAAMTERRRVHAADLEARAERRAIAAARAQAEAWSPLLAGLLRPQPQPAPVIVQSDTQELPR